MSLSASEAADLTDVEIEFFNAGFRLDAGELTEMEALAYADDVEPRPGLFRRLFGRAR